MNFQDINIESILDEYISVGITYLFKDIEKIIQ